jgi:pimeloyl-ACP methyl ester carboxylesterase
MIARSTAAALMAGLCALGAPAVAVAASDYCVPQNSHYDPRDVPADGSQLQTAPGVSRELVQVDGITTPVLSSGPRESREAVVFMHGSPGSSQDWLELQQHVGALGRRTVAWDMPGFGHADKPWGLPLGIEPASAFAQHMLERLGIERVHLVLQDLGGATGLQWGSEHPDALVSAVLMDAGLLGYRHHNFAQISRTPEFGESFMLALNRQLWSQGMQEGQRERPLPQSFIDRIYDDLDRETRCLILRVYRSAEEEQIEQWGRAQADVLSRRRRPALIIWGRHDPYLPPEMAERQREVFPGAPIHIFEESGHWPFADDPERTAALVVPFVRCLPTGERDRIRLSVRPRRLRVGRQARVRFRATVRSQGLTRPVCDATVRFAGRKRTTNQHGAARMTVRPRRAGRRRARARKAGLRRGGARVAVVP